MGEFFRRIYRWRYRLLVGSMLLIGGGVAGVIITLWPTSLAALRTESVRIIVVPHHMIAASYVDRLYNTIAASGFRPDRVLVISPNHFNAWTQAVESAPRAEEACFRQVCVPVVSFVGFHPQSSAFPLFRLWGSVSQKPQTTTNEHGIGEHFSFIRKYFGVVPITPIVLRRELRPSLGVDTLAQTIIQNYFTPTQASSNIPRTLVVVSVDFSHKNTDTIAIPHDALSIELLRHAVHSQEFAHAEVDCRNCLALARQIAIQTGRSQFRLMARTSAEQLTTKRLGYDNTSHVLGTFEPPEVWEFSANVSNQTSTGVFAFFGDANYARNLEGKIPIHAALAWLYETENPNLNPASYYHRPLSGFDGVAINFESSLWASGTCIPTKPEALTLVTQPYAVDTFARLGITLANMANNHSTDCANISLNQIATTLKQSGITPFGMPNASGSIAPAIQNVRGTWFAFFGFSVFDSTTQTGALVQAVSLATQSGLLPVVSLHWGTEYSTGVTIAQQKFAHTLIHAGARLIIGHHSHVVGTTETYQGVPIYYSLGNFIFDQTHSSTLSGFGVACSISAKYTACSPIPFARSSKTAAISF